jgi:methylated-DNA-[protein]-cysteine S-methyltransferase
MEVAGARPYSHLGFQVIRYSEIVKTTKDTFIAFKSPIGIIRVFEGNGKVIAIDIAVPGAKIAISTSPLLKAAQKELETYFQGKLTKFTFPVDISHGTEFQKSVWQEISKIKFGQIKTYADIAQAIGKPKAARAVGGAVGSNPVPIVIGCHRVLGASGKITGYSGGKGLPTKRVLLTLEGIESKE